MSPSFPLYIQKAPGSEESENRGLSFIEGPETVAPHLLLSAYKCVRERTLIECADQLDKYLAVVEGAVISSGGRSGDGRPNHRIRIAAVSKGYLATFGIAVQIEQGNAA